MPSCIAFADATTVPAAVNWTGWRGHHRDGRAPWLPDSLPAEPRIVWSLPMTGDGLAGVAATSELVLVADRDPSDSQDIWRCLDAELGLELWQLAYTAEGQLDYGNSPRATPLLEEGRVYLQGALGHLHCVDVGSGEVVWKKDLLAEFGGELPIWGFCASPLAVDGKLIVNPGAPQAFLAAIEPATGDVVWKTPGRKAAYASFVAAELGGVRQIIGYDKTTLGGWDVATGRRLWELAPDISGDFNVPTPVPLGDRLLVTSENNGTRLYAFNKAGVIVPHPVARHARLAPDSSTPVVVDGQVFGVWKEMYCLSAADALAPRWTGRDRLFRDYASLIAAPGRVLVTTTRGELLLIDARADAFTVLSRLQVIEDDSEVHSHPALVGTRLFVRSATRLVCVELAAPAL
jgi:outer membrane protein assembly factor BamB